MRDPTTGDVERSGGSTIALYQWLSAEPELRGRLDIRSAEPTAGQLGAMTEAIIVALGSGGFVTVLARSVAVWLRQRRSDLTLEIHTTPHDRTVRVEANRVADVETLLRTVLDGESEATIVPTTDTSRSSEPCGGRWSIS